MGPDGYLDLTLKLRTPALAEKLAFETPGLAPGDVVPLRLSGRLLDGSPIEGIDCVVIVGRVPDSVAAARGDLNDDGYVDMFDFAVLSRHWLEVAELCD